MASQLLKASCASYTRRARSARFVPVIRKTQNNRNFTLSHLYLEPYIPMLGTTKKQENHQIFLFFSSGSGIRTARPSGYEPDELPTALSRDIGLQIYGHFLKPQIFIAKNHNQDRKVIIPSRSSFEKDFCSPVERFLIFTTPSATSLPPTMDKNGIAFLSA